jgi:hypothetical protein
VASGGELLQHKQRMGGGEVALKRERRRIRGGFHRAMAATTVLGPNPNERAALRWLVEDKWQR